MQRDTIKIQKYSPCFLSSFASLHLAAHCEDVPNESSLQQKLLSFQFSLYELTKGEK